jgi:hypothetical protein
VQLVAWRVVSDGQPREELAPESIVCEPKANFIFREIRRLADRHNEGRLTACACFQRKGPRQLCRALERRSRRYGGATMPTPSRFSTMTPQGRDSLSARSMIFAASSPVARGRL